MVGMGSWHLGAKGLLSSGHSLDDGVLRMSLGGGQMGTKDPKAKGILKGKKG